MARILANIRKITNISRHNNADNLDVLTIDGWQCIAKKDEFIIGDLCMYISIDSLIHINTNTHTSNDDDTQYNDKYGINWLPDGFKGIRYKKKPDYIKIKTIIIRGQISQGLAIHQKYFDNINFNDYYQNHDVNDNYDNFDFSEMLNIIKDDDDITNSKYIIGDFPEHIIPKTDVYRIQDKQSYLNDINNNPTGINITMKIDGTSATYYKNEDGKIVACSRNKQTIEPLYTNITAEYNLEDKLNLYPYIALQGEICGPKIQGNKLNLAKKQIMFYSAYNFIEHKYLSFHELQNLMNELDLPFVPIINYYPNYDINQNNDIDLNHDLGNYTIEQLFEIAKQNYPNTNNLIEGIVISTNDYKYKLKIINNEYLINNRK